MGYRDLFEKFLKSGGQATPATQPVSNRSAPLPATSNAFTARAYAELILACLFDARASLKRDEPVYILELGADTGAFAFYCLKELQAKKCFFNELQGMDLRYVMTDFTEKNVASWETHERLRSYQNSGVLDCAVYRPEREESLVIRHAGITIAPGGIRNPVIVIANYFFQRLRQDLLTISDGKLQEDAPYANSRLRAILEEYSRQLKEATIRFPVGALDCIRNLQRLSGDNLILISSDTGFTTIEHKPPEGDAHQTHSVRRGAASDMVNFHAIGRYFENLGGRTLFTSDNTLPVQTTLNVLLSHQPCSLEYSRYAFDEIIVRRNPINYLRQCQELLQNATHVDITSYLSFLRMSNFDPVALSLCGDNILQALEEINQSEEESLVEILELTAVNVYEVQSDQNAYMWLGRIYYGLRLYDECLKMFEASEQVLGPDAPSLYFIGACHEAKGNHVTALRYYRRVLDADPEHEYALAGIQRTSGRSS